MRATHADKWTAFLLSLFAPGAGQFFARRRSCVVWWIAAAAAVSGSLLFAPGNPALSAACIGLWVVISGASALHAKRSLEFRPPWTPTQGVTAVVRSESPRGKRIRLGIDINIPRPADEVWDRVSQVESFLCIDPFHTRIVPLDGCLEVRGLLVLEHNALGIRFTRQGRLLRWREGNGYSLSDLSTRDPRRGFPHVFHVALQPTEDGQATQLSIDVRGRWTSDFVSPQLGMLWLKWVMHEHARLLHAAM